MKVVIVGAGFSGSIIARLLAEQGLMLDICEKRSHLAGNAFDKYDDNGVLIHQYGPHIFHTNSKKIFDFLSRFTDWIPYEHKVYSVVNGIEYPFPINLNTINKLYNLSLKEEDAAKFYEKVRVPIEHPRTSAEVVLNSVGHDLYEKFFLNYTKKQWGLDPSELKAGVAARIPTRTNTDDRYFTDTYQGMPAEGYTRMFERILDHPGISIQLNTDFFDVREKYKDCHLVYTGPIDSYFNYQYGKLPYRSLKFVHEHIKTKWYQSVGTVNYPNDFEFTRITEFKHLTGQAHPFTSIAREYPMAEGDPYYPIPTEANEILFRRYECLAKLEQNVTFVGRLAQYKYYNMDQVVGAAMVAANNIIEKLKS